MLIVYFVELNSYPTTRVYTTSESELTGGCIDVEWFRGYAKELHDTVDDIYEEFVSDFDENTLVICPGLFGLSLAWSCLINFQNLRVII